MALRGLPTPQHRSSASHLANEAFVEQIFSSWCAGRSESRSSSPSHARQGQIRAHAVTDSPASINRRPDRRHPKGFRGASERLPGRACRRSRRAPPPKCIWEDYSHMGSPAMYRAICIEGDTRDTRTHGSQRREPHKRSLTTIPHPCAQTCPNAEGFQMWVRESPDHIAECSTDRPAHRPGPPDGPAAPSIPGSMLLVHTSRGIQ